MEKEGKKKREGEGGKEREIIKGRKGEGEKEGEEKE